MKQAKLPNGTILKVGDTVKIRLALTPNRIVEGKIMDFRERGELGWMKVKHADGAEWTSIVNQVRFIGIDNLLVALKDESRQDAYEAAAVAEVETQTAPPEDDWSFPDGLDNVKPATETPSNDLNFDF